MSENQIVESAATPEVQAKAEKMGWIPPSRFKGDPEKFVDADIYIERGETVLPILREHNKRLHTEMETLRAENRRTQDALRNATLAIEQIEERHSVETQKAVERAREQVKAQLAAASQAGDHEGVAELTDQLTKLNAAEREAETGKKPETAAPQAFVPDPELKAWNDENPWFGKDRKKTAVALAAAEELRTGGETAQGRDFFELVKAEVEKVFPPAEKETPTSKVEEGRSGTPGESSRGGKKGFAALPQDAKDACNADVKKFVGPGKRYKTADEWRARYAEMYFG